MEIIFKGVPYEIEKFMNEVFYPVIYQRQHETEGHYFRITEDKGDYWSRRPESGIKVRRIRGYFPGFYYPEDWYKDKYKPTVTRDDVLRQQEESKPDFDDSTWY